MKKKTNNKNRLAKNNKRNKKDKNKHNFSKAKNRTERKEILAKIQEKRLDRMPEDLSFCFVGKLAKKNKGFGFVEPISDVEINDLIKKYKVDLSNFNEDIYISKEQSMGANNNDIVLVRINDQKRHYEGTVIRILKRNTENITGIYEASDNFGFVKPLDRSFSTDIYIRKEDSLDAKSGDAVLVYITKYPERDKKTEGRIIKVLADKTDPLIDLKILLAENNIEEDFPEKVKKELKYIPTEVKDNDLVGRTNYTGLRTYTIDGENAKDFDDAISIKKTGNFYHLYIHIADVSHYVTEESEVDQEARLRGFSIYLLNKVIPMLDFKISNNICSLIAGENRLTMTVYLKIGHNGDIIESNISKSYINVDRRMTYNLVQDILDKKIEDKDKNDFLVMEELAKILKKKREEKGYINFDLPEPEFILDKDGRIIDIKPENRKFSDEIIEQFMLLANETVGQFMKDKRLPVIFRVHEEPDIDKVFEIKDVIEALGFKVAFLNNQKYTDSKKEYYKRLDNKSKNKSIHGIRGEQKRKQQYERFKSNIRVSSKEYSDFLNSIENKDLKEIVSGIMLRSMRLAKYSEIDLGHFGISTESYSHFTAPIRRYPDLFVHRVLKKSLDKTITINEKNQYNKQARRVAEGATMIESKIVALEREYYDIKTAEFMDDKIGKEFEGKISSITNFGIYVKLFGSVEGLVRYSDMDTFVEYNERTRQGLEKKTNTIYKLGDSVKVKVIAVDKKEGNIDFILI